MNKFVFVLEKEKNLEKIQIFYQCAAEDLKDAEAELRKDIESEGSKITSPHIIWCKIRSMEDLMKSKTHPKTLKGEELEEFAGYIENI